jgi:hypothetical protein
MAAGVQHYVTGGTTGAAVGSLGGPIGAGIGAGIGLLGAGLGLFGDNSAEEALKKKQAQMAEEAKRRQAEMQRMRMNALGQQMLAFNPQNQMMAQMFGPEAAFSPQQFAQMAADPGARSREEFDAAHAKAMEQPWQDRRMEGWTAADKKRMEEDEKRRRMISEQMTPLGPGPAPLRLPPAQAARRY